MCPVLRKCVIGNHINLPPKNVLPLAFPLKKSRRRHCREMGSDDPATVIADFSCMGGGADNDGFRLVAVQQQITHSHGSAKVF